MSSKLLEVHDGRGSADPESLSEVSSEFDEETRMIPNGPSSTERLHNTVKRWLALLLWLITIVPVILSMLRVPLPSYFGINLAVWAHFGLTMIFVQAGVRLTIYMLLRWMRRADSRDISSGSIEGESVDFASYLESVVVPLTMFISTIIFAALWYAVYPYGCPPDPAIVAETVSAAAASGAGDVISIPIVDEETAAASLAMNAFKTNNSTNSNGKISSFFARLFGGICIYEFMTDLIICTLIINLMIIVETILMRVGHWRFLRSNFQDRILESRYRTYVVESVRHRTSPILLESNGTLNEARPIAFPFILPFSVPLFDRLLAWMNAGILDSGPKSFDSMISGRPLGYLEYKRKLKGWVERHGLDEAVDFVAQTVPQTDSEAKLVAKDLFGKLCNADRDYVIPNDFQPIFQGRAATRDAYNTFDRDQDGTVSKTEFRHTCIMVYREMRNLAASVKDAGEAFEKLTDSIHLIVVLALVFISLAIFGVHVQSLFAIILSLVLGLNVIVGDVAKRSFQGIIFLFVDHPYDVGDRVLVSSLSESDPLVIHRINMLTTVFHRWNGQEVYAPNANLASATIYNISRSSEQWERIDFKVSIGEEDKAQGADKMGLFRDRLEAFLKTRGADYMSAYVLQPVVAGEVGGAEAALDSLKMTLRVQCRPTLDSQKRWSRHSKLLTFVRTAIGASGLQLIGLKSVD